MTETNTDGDDDDFYYGANALELWRVYEHSRANNKPDNRKKQYRL